MRTNVFTFLLTILGFGLVHAQYTDADAVRFAETITENELKEHLYTYASDEFEGRDTGSKGQKLAVAYLKDFYVSQNIGAAQTDGSYFQKVPVSMNKTPEGSIEIDGNTLSLGTDFVSFTPLNASFDDIVFVSYGIHESEYSNYKTVDVSGKLVFAISGEPADANGNYLLSGSTEISKWSNRSEGLTKRVEAARMHGAKGLLFFDPVNFDRYKSYLNFMRRNNSGRMQLDAEGAPYFSAHISESVAQNLLAKVSDQKKSELLKTSASVAMEAGKIAIDTENVVAYIEGNEKPDEYVIISSHLDHIGMTRDGEINNGADDDGSGSVAMLEIAQAFKLAAENGSAPKRSIVFLHVTGEEKGLLGSKYYTDYQPVFPLNQTITNLNIDMIGRIDPKREGKRNYIYLIGSDKLSQDLHQVSEEVNSKFMNIELDYTFNDENDPNRFYYRSDHYNFAKNNVPIIFYFNGTHDDYHRVGDTPDKINYDLLENRSRLIFHTAWVVANRAESIALDQ